jgi:predicted 3-demethylubiquinone-9 3-methyltransferase (glyoxalase superfamily)
MSKITPCLCFDGEAEEAANFYVSLLPESKIETVQRNSVDSPGGKAGTVLVVVYTVAAPRFMALNGGTRLEHTHAISFKIDCADQAEVDHYWDGLIANGGQESQCGWLKDPFGVSWQVVPARLPQLLQDPDPARAQRAMQAMLRMRRLVVADLEAAADGTAQPVG